MGRERKREREREGGRRSGREKGRAFIIECQIRHVDNDYFATPPYNNN